LRKPGKRAVIYAIFLMILLILAFAGSVVISSPERQASEVEPFTSPIQRLGEADPAESALLTPDTMKADFDYLISTLEQVHPSLIDGWQREQRKKIRDTYRMIQAGPLPISRFYISAVEMIGQLHDAHTSINPYSPSLSYLELPLYWTAEGPVVIRSTPLLQRGDLLLELGGLTPPQLLDELSKVVPTENEHWLKIMGRPMLAHPLTRLTVTCIY